MIVQHIQTSLALGLKWIGGPESTGPHHQWWAYPNHDWDLNHDLDHFGESIWDVLDMQYIRGIA